MTTTEKMSEVVGTHRWCCFCGQENETEVTRHDVDAGFVSDYCSGNHHHMETFKIDEDWLQ